MDQRIGLFLVVMFFIAWSTAEPQSIPPPRDDSDTLIRLSPQPNTPVRQVVSQGDKRVKLDQPQVIQPFSGPREFGLRHNPVSIETHKNQGHVLQFPNVQFQDIRGNDETASSSSSSSPKESQDLRSSSFTASDNSRLPSRLIPHLGGPLGDLPTAGELASVGAQSTHTPQPGSGRLLVQGVSFVTGEQVPSGPVDDLPSPFWRDPAGRTPSPPPTVTPAQLTITKLPCDLGGRVPACDAYARYRRVNASCNNLGRPEQGRAGAVLQRVFSNPTDVTMMRRLSVTGRLLPNPRTVSEATRAVRPEPRHGDINVFFVFLGQFIDHDMVFTPVAKDPEDEGKGLRCGNCSSWVRHPGCAPINVSPYDSVFSGPRGQACLPFTRSVGQPIIDSSGREYVEKVNLNTAYLDLSTVYGSDDCLLRELRSFESGMLLTTGTPASSYGLPVAATRSHFDACASKSSLCYRAGDERSSENVGLLVLHALFLREHNHLCMELEKINPGWEDEQIFQEARRLNIAQYQHMVFNEFLPALLGPSPYVRKYKIDTPQMPYPRPIYNAETRGEILLELSSAAFRFGHTLVPDTLILADEALRPMGSVALVEVFDNPSIMQEAIRGSMVDALLRGLLSTRFESPDLEVVASLRDKLFVAANDSKSGQDLVAKNIARGRDHGIAPYTAYRELCELPRVKAWEDLSPLMSAEHVEKFRTVYDHWDDIDLFIGGIAETVEDFGVVGPTFACLISLQFHLLSTGDRFWYQGGPAGLSAAELHTVYSSGLLAKLIARNIDEVKSLVPLDALRIPNIVSNPALMAGTMLGTDLRPWMDPLALRPKDCDFKGRSHPTGALVFVSPCLVCQCGADGNLQCHDRPVDCRALDAYAPGARESEHCHKVCPVLP